MYLMRVGARATGPQEKQRSPFWSGRLFSFVICSFIFLSIPLLATQLEEQRLPPAARVKIEFSRDIQPIFEKCCWRCHGPEKAKSHFRLDSREAALKGGENGVDIVPGKSARSPLIGYVAGLVRDMEMPPPGKADPLSTNEVALLRAWIDQGVPWAVTNQIAGNIPKR
jgi:Planctomycete cytochrome C